MKNIFRNARSQHTRAPVLRKQLESVLFQKKKKRKEVTSQDGGRQGAGNRRTRTKSSGRWRREMVGASCGQGTADSVQKGRGQTFPEMDLQATQQANILLGHLVQV